LEGTLPETEIAGLVLAGGKSMRFGGSTKALQLLGGIPLIEHALRPLRPLKRIAINANGGAADLSRYGTPIVADIVEDGGPLGGVHAGLAWAAKLEPRPRFLATVPVDMPFLPGDFIVRLVRHNSPAAVAVASTQNDFSPIAALWRVDQLALLADALGRGLRKVTDALDLLGWRKADLGGCRVDPLFNINTAERLAEAERLLSDFAAPRPT
jgi:molybdenum cofactor guanylyltransferase